MKLTSIQRPRYLNVSAISKMGFSRQARKFPIKLRPPYYFGKRLVSYVHCDELSPQEFQPPTRQVYRQLAVQHRQCCASGNLLDSQRLRSV